MTTGQGQGGGTTLVGQQSSGKANWLLVAATVLVLGALAYLIYEMVHPKFTPDDEQVSGFVVDPALRDRPECPDSIDSTFVLTGPITNIPEFHDCQRFIYKKTQGATDWSYGAYYAIWIRNRIDTIKFPSPLALNSGTTNVPNTADTGPKVADSVKGGGQITPPAQTTVPKSVGAYGVPVALIYSYGSKYHPLSIEPGFNCLYLYHPKTNPSGWSSKMVPVQYQYQCDTNRDPEDLPGGVLEVRRIANLEYGDKDYPAVARWDRDPISGHQYAGLRCELAWCEVGDAGFKSSSPYSATAGGQRVWGIKGWYDEQYLAVNVNNALVPGLVMGTAYPDSDLWKRSKTDFMKHWLPAAHIVLHSSSDAYFGKVEFGPGSVPDPSNVISLCYGVESDCIPANWLDKVKCGDQGNPTYWAMFSPVARTDTLYRCVKYRDHMGIGMPATVRWRWEANDETNWVRCPDGCCQVHY